MRRASLLLSLLFAAIAAAVPADRGAALREWRHAVLVPAHPLSDADRAALAEKGIRIGAPLSGGRHIVRVAENADLSDPRIASVDELRPAQKIDSSAWREFAQGRTMARVNVVFHRDVEFDAARQAILAAGGVLDPFRVRFSPTQRIEARVSSSALAALAAHDDVLAIGGVRNLRVKTDNAVSAQVAHVTELLAAPYNLTGDGVNVSIFELAEGQASHVEFNGRLTVIGTGGSSGDKRHATHVAGTIGAGGVRADAKGMAPGARLHQFCIQEACSGNLTFLDDKDQKLAPLGVTLDNNSWGFILGWNVEDGEQVWNDLDLYFGAYDLYLVSPIDQISNDKNILFMHSAGNEGDPPTFNDAYSSHRHVDDEGNADKTKMYCYTLVGSGSDCPSSCTGGCEKNKHLPTLPYGTLGLTAAAKNVIAVGAVSGNKNIIDFSSRGPA
ncbi:MAG TPA: S8 family serine peptidase, partial [Thermoanaerobaculia bacterium]|nr:S8 family serine peptidase [Thermoanaerobaculia bacterium]